MKVLFLDAVHPILSERLTAAGMVCVDGTSHTALEAVSSHGDAAGIVLRSKIRVDSELLDRLPALAFHLPLWARVLKTSMLHPPLRAGSRSSTAPKATGTQWVSTPSACFCP